MRVARLAVTALVALALSGCAGGAGTNGARLRPSANPSAVIAAELAFAQAAQTKGQWTAFRDTSTDDAVMFTPQPVNAHQFLKGKPDPAQPLKWQPYEVWSSCDGSLAVDKGAWQAAAGATGFFTTIWKRQGNGDYKWIYDGGDALPSPLPAAEMIGAHVASCEHLDKATPYPAILSPVGVRYLTGQSDDRSLRWTARVDAAGARVFRVELWNGVSYDEALRQDIAAPAAG